MSFKAGTLIGALFLLLVGCGYYSFKGNLPPHLHDIEVKLFENQTIEPDIDMDLEEQLSRRFEEERILPLAAGEQADSYLAGKILKAQDLPYTYDENEKVKSYRLVVDVEVSWFDKVQQKVLFDKRFHEFDVYYSDLENSRLAPENRVERTQAYQNVLQKIVDDIIEAMTARW